jgi:hypothetical protein
MPLTNEAPHPKQKRACAGFVVPQIKHCIKATFQPIEFGKKLAT